MTSSQMAMNVSGQLNHDLREPINAIRRKLELLQVQKLTSTKAIEARESYIDTTRGSCEKILQAIRNVRNSVLTDSITDEDFERRVDHVVKDAARLASYTARVDQTWSVGERGPDQERHLNFIRSTSVRFQKMLKALLTIAKITEPTFVRTNFYNQAANASEYILERLHSDPSWRNGFDIFEWTEARASGLADQGMILTIFQNLYENAVKYRSDARNLRIKTDIREVSTQEAIAKFPQTADVLSLNPSNTIHISVADNGMGISPGYSSRIFEAYYQIDGTKKQSKPPLDGDDVDEKDVGIGLFTVKKMVAAHFGYVLVTSDGKTGSTFHILLPFDPARVAIEMAK